MARELTYYNLERAVTRRRFSIVDWLVMIVSVVVAAGMALSWAARWLHPEAYGFMSTAGLFVPVFFALNFLCLLYWVIRWRKGVWLPLVVLVCSAWSFTLFFRPDLTRRHGDYSTDRSLVSVVSYNVRGMMQPALGSSGRIRSSMRDVVAVVDSLRPDILCIQEFQSTVENPASRFEEALGGYRYKRVRFNIRGTAEDHGWGNAIYSKFPITNSGYIDFDGTNNSVLWADVQVGRQTLRVYCAHLQTTSIKVDDERYIVEGGFVNDSTRAGKMRQLIDKLTRNYVIRASQAEALRSSIDSSPNPVVVCGDFNDTPASWAYRKISHGLRDGFRQAGQGYGYTYRGFFNLLRIDYVLYSRGIDCVDYLSPSFDTSDHNPVSVKLRLN